MTNDDRMKQALEGIEKELKERLEELRTQGKLLEAQRLEQRTTYDIEMMREMGYCSGIENYSKYMDNRQMNRPFTLLDFFPKDFLLVVDESHVTMPQVRGCITVTRLASKCWSIMVSDLKARLTIVR